MIAQTKGSLPIVLGIPHSGTQVPDELVDNFNATGQKMAETDWHIPRLYNGLGMDVSVVEMSTHRYVIDVDQSPLVTSAFPWMARHALVPLTDARGRALYQDGATPDSAEIERRLATYHTPYQAALAAELARLKAEHGVALLVDCHSKSANYTSDSPELLSDFNIWTDQSKTCGRALERAVLMRCRSVEDTETRLADGCAAGWSVRHHGQPSAGIHALRLELAQGLYMNDLPPWTWRPERAERLRSTLYRVLNDLLELLYERAQR